VSDPTAVRRDYYTDGLGPEDLDPNPVVQVRAWLQEALEAGIGEPNAMTVCTVRPDGTPNARVLLLRGVGEDGFRFYGNRESQKGRELAVFPHAALVFHWPALHRQVRVSGAVEPLPDAESDAYFATRPRGSRLGAWASPQSRPLPSREALDAAVADAEARFAGTDDVPRPPYWGGWRLVPREVEFWQGRPSRLHDRVRYVREESGRWRVERLAP